MIEYLDRLSRRGVLNIEAQDGSYAVTFKAHGPWIGGRCTTDEADLYEYCRLGAKNWHGEGTDLAALLVLCEVESRPDTHDIDDLVWRIESRRNGRTYGPPLPSYLRYHGGWRHGQERWLRCSGHKYEYMGGYLRDLEIERQANAEAAETAARRERAEHHRRVEHARKVLS